MKGFTIFAISALVSAAVAFPTTYKEPEIEEIAKPRGFGLGFGVSGFNDYANFYDHANYPVYYERPSYPAYYDPYRPYGRPPYYRYNGQHTGLYAGIGGSIGFGVGTNVGIGYGGGYGGGDYWGLL